MTESAVKIRVIQGDIAQVKADILVNAVNTTLSFPTEEGVAGSLLTAAGQDIRDRLNKTRLERGGLEPSIPIATPAGQLQARYLFHVAGPVHEEGSRNERQRLVDSYLNCLELAEQLKARSIAFPNISTGNNIFPKARAARAIFEALQPALQQVQSIKEVLFVCHNTENYKIYTQLWGDIM